MTVRKLLRFGQELAKYRVIEARVKRVLFNFLKNKLRKAFISPLKVTCSLSERKEVDCAEAAYSWTCKP
jgi:hypothetical protein